MNQVSIDWQPLSLYGKLTSPNDDSCLTLCIKDAIHFPGCPSGASAAPQAFLLTASSYSHSTSTVLHSICFMISSRFSFFLSPSTARSYQSTEMTFERAASNIKVTCPPCLFWLPSWEYVNQSTALINCMWVMSSH